MDSNSLLYDSDLAHDSGNRNRADGSDHADARAERTIRPPSRHRTMDISHLALRIGNGRDRLPDAISDACVELAAEAMPMNQSPKNIDKYIASFPADVQAILEKIRLTIRKAAPDAQEIISYKMPTFTIHGIVLVHFAAFKKHIGLFPPVRGDAKLEKATAIYAGEKGNLRFPLDQPIPYGLIRRLVIFRAKRNLLKTRASTKG